jgi:ligand-binding sensor domain-containing protein/signal transduction histidine kinase
VIAFLNKLLTIALLYLFVFSQLKAQPAYFAHYQVENGLSNNTVQCSLQDNNGFLWFGTKDGLNRFDGYTFKIFRNNSLNEGSIGSNIIRCMHLDSNGTVWVGTERGIYQYNSLKESFIHLTASADREIRSIQTDKKGNIWFIGGLIIYKQNLNTGKFKVYTHVNFEATSLALVNGNIWVSTANGSIERYNETDDIFKGVDLFNHSPPPTSRWVNNIFNAGGEQIFVGTSNQGVKLFNIKTGGYEDILTYNADKTEIFARDFIKKDDYNYWIGTESGIYNYNLTTKKATLLHKQYNNPYSLSDNAIYTFCKDREGGIWVGTYFGGLNYYTQQYTFFEKFFPKVGENSISGNAVREICPDNYGNVWIGTEDGGLNRYVTKTGQFYNYKPLGGAADVASSNIHALLANNNQLLIGMFEHGLDVMDIKTQKVLRHCTVSNSPNLHSNFIYCIYKTQQGLIIVGTSRGLYIYNSKTYQFKLIKEVPDNLFYISIYEDANHTLWVGTYRNGLYYLNLNNKTQGLYLHNENDEHSLSDNHVNKVFEDSNKQLWMATENGLCKFDKATKRFAHYNTFNGLPSNLIYALLEDDKKNLWISTSRGLVCMNLGNYAITTYTKSNGLLSDQFNYNSAYKDKLGNMYFGCVKGLIKFNPTNLVRNTYRASVYLTGFQVNNKEISTSTPQSPLTKSIIYTDHIRLNHTQSSFSVDFSALSFISPQMTEYAYKMDGLDKDWTYLKSNRKVYFTRLASGSYIFNVKARIGNSAWSNHVTRLFIEISPPFWATVYAYLFYILIIASAIYLLVRDYHRKTIEKNKRNIKVLENQKEKEIYEAKIAFFTHVAHEIRTPLTLIRGPLEKVLKKATAIPDAEKNLKIMERNTERLLMLTNQLLDFRKTETHGFSLNFVKTNITSLIKENLLRFSSAIEAKGLNIKFEIHERTFYAYVDAEALNKILSNLLDNALKYAVKNVYLRLETNPDGNHFNIIIKNDGHLIPYEMREKVFERFFRMKEAEQQPGTGIGLPLSRYLAQLHKGDLSLEASEDNLNVFLLTIPIHQDIEFNL